jgi:hypothetical protein
MNDTKVLPVDYRRAEPIGEWLRLQVIIVLTALVRAQTPSSSSDGDSSYSNE